MSRMLILRQPLLCAGASQLCSSSGFSYCAAAADAERLNRPLFSSPRWGNASDALAPVGSDDGGPEA